MNHIYRIIWSQVTNAWVAVAESSRGRDKGSSRKLAAAALSLTASFAQAAPAGGEVVAGSGNIAQSGNTTTVTQTSQNLSLNWQGFNIGKQETVNFAQPSASAIAVNRIFDTNGSQILGHLNANGHVYLINPNGILFGQGAQVNVGALVASTLNVNDASLSGNARQFSGAGAGSIVNLGAINAARGGYVALLGNTVSNQGTITAPLGAVALGAGNAVTLNFNGNSLVRMQVDQSVLNSLAENGGLIRADGGLVVMNAGAKNALLASVVNNTGKIEARTVENREGTIILLGGMEAGTVHVDGTLDASAPTGGNGGFVETSAAQVKVAGNVKITTAATAGTVGHWLIDPVDFTIAAAGGDISGTDLGNLLASNSITVQTASGTNTAANLYGATGSNGDIHVNDTVSWASSNTLTLDAWRNININKSITATGTSGKLALKYGQGATDGVIASSVATYNVHAPVNLNAGNNFSTQLGSAGGVKNYTVITSLGAEGSTTGTDLQGIQGSQGRNYALGGNIDASSTSSWNTNAGFVPISGFNGSFDGLGHTISNIVINRPNAGSYSGLFGQTQSASTISNVGLVGGSVNGYNYTGSLVGLNGGTINNSFSTANVHGNLYYTAGLVSFNSNSGVIFNSYASGTVTGEDSSGLVAYNFGTIKNSYASGNTTGLNASGLVAYNSGTISSSYANGIATGEHSSGLVAYNFGTIRNSFWDSTVTPNLAGIATGSQVGATGLTSAQFKQFSSFSSWNIDTPNSIASTGGSGAIWRIYEGNTAPLLTGFMTGLTLSNASATYNGSAITGTTTALSGISGTAAQGTNAGTYLTGYYSNQQGYDISGGNLTINAAVLSAISLNGTRAYDGTVDVAAGIFTLSGLIGEQYLTLTGSGTVVDKNVGSNKTVTLGTLALGNGSGGLASNYTFDGGTQTASITKANLSVTAAAVTKTYDSTLNATGSATIGTLAGATAGETVLSNGSLAFLDKNAGTGTKTVRASGVTIKDAGGTDVSANYAIAYTDNTTSTIAKAELAVSGLSAAGKVYDATANATLAGNASISKLGTDDVALAGSAVGTFASKNAGSRSVTVSGNTLAGLDAGNYTLLQQAGLTATISKASLSYTAASANFLNGQTPNNLSGTVNGFAAGDNLANASSGALNWTTPANAASQPGSYAIDGSGLLAANYSLVQAASNATALTLTPATASAPVLNATRQLASISATPLMIVPPAVIRISPAISVTQTTTVEVAGSGTGSGSKTDSVASANTSMTIGSSGPALQIVNGGMRMPVVNDKVNE